MDVTDCPAIRLITDSKKNSASTSANTKTRSSQSSFDFFVIDQNREIPLRNATVKHNTIKAYSRMKQNASITTIGLEDETEIKHR